MRYIIYVILLSSCGEENINNPDDPIQISPECLSCGYVPDDDYVLPVAGEYVQAEPDNIGFYSVYNEDFVSEIRSTKIVNHTDDIVVLNNVYISADTDSFTGNADCLQHFQLLENYNKKEIQPFSYLPIEIEFDGSAKECSAILYVHVSFDNICLPVELRGKTFIW